MELKTNLLLLDRQWLTEQKETRRLTKNTGSHAGCQISRTGDLDYSKWVSVSCCSSETCCLTPASRLLGDHLKYGDAFCVSRKFRSVEENEQKIWVSKRVWGGGTHFHKVWDQEEAWKRGEWLFLSLNSLNSHFLYTVCSLFTSCTCVYCSFKL